MAPTKTSQFSDAALQHRLELANQRSGFGLLISNARVFGIACFACIGGLLYGYNQGVFSGILTMHSFNRHMGDYTTDQTKKGWLTSILELGAWFGTMVCLPPFQHLFATTDSMQSTLVSLLRLSPENIPSLSTPVSSSSVSSFRRRLSHPVIVVSLEAVSSSVWQSALSQ